MKNFLDKVKQFPGKLKSFVLKNAKTLKSFGFAFLTVAAVSVVTFLLLLAFNIIYVDDGMKFNVELFSAFKSTWYGWVIFILLQTVLCMLLCVIPGASMAFILLSKTLYPIAWQSFLLSFSSVMVCSTAMYLVGRFGGYNLCVKFLGEEDCEKSLGLLRDKGTVYFPLMMMFPIFPDDALVMIAGTLKMSLKWFIPSIIVGRGIGICTIVFGLSLVPFDKFTSIFHWILFILLCALLIFLVFFTAHKFNNMMERKRNAAEASVTDEANGEATRESDVAVTEESSEDIIENSASEADESADALTESTAEDSIEE